MSAKAYKTKLVEPFVKRLIKFILDLARRCYRAEKREEESVEKLSKLQEEKEELRNKMWDLKLENTHLKKELKDFEKIKSYSKQLRMTRAMVLELYMHFEIRKDGNHKDPLNYIK